MSPLSAKFDRTHHQTVPPANAQAGRHSLKSGSHLPTMWRGRCWTVAVILKKLFYVSRAVRPWSVTEAKCLIGTSQVANRRADITGVLAFTGGFFGQLLEGPEVPVTALAQRIRDDTRHSDFRVISCERADARDFPNWNMELIESPQLEAELRELTLHAPLGDELGIVTRRRILDEANWRSVRG